jgi:hypothetical protein
MEPLQATVIIEDVPDGSRVIIRYADGHTVYLSVGQDSIILRRHLGLDDEGQDSPVS